MRLLPRKRRRRSWVASLLKIALGSVPAALVSLNLAVLESIIVVPPNAEVNQTTYESPIVVPEKEEKVVEKELHQPISEKQQSSYQLYGELLHYRYAFGFAVWERLLKEGASLLKGDSHKPGAVVVVGARHGNQCLQAAKAGFQTYCVEPSPKSYKKLVDNVKKADLDIQERIHLHDFAASASSGGTIIFQSSGGAGDHVGKADMWRMTPITKIYNQKGEIVVVPQKRLDDLLEPIDEVFLMHIDTQGYEPAAFDGLSKSIRQRKIKFIILLYWPRAMDILAGKDNECIAAELLNHLASVGYKLFALPVAAHPKAPQGYKSAKGRPMQNLTADCRWFFDLEKQFPSDEYKMGYWSEILAVAPGMHLDHPVSSLGKIF